MTNELDKIKSDISELRLIFSQKLTALQERVDKVEKENNTSAHLGLTQNSEAQPPLLVKKEATAENAIKPAVNPQQPLPWKKVYIENEKTAAGDQFKKDVVETSFLDSLQFILGPFNTLIQPVVDIYKKSLRKKRSSLFSF